MHKIFKINIVKHSEKIFTKKGLVLISFILLLGIIFTIMQKSEKFESFFGIKYPEITFNPLDFTPAKEHKIGIINDAHGKFTRSSEEIKEESMLPMLRFVSEMNNNFKPEVAFDGGDFIDGTRRFGEKSINDYHLFQKTFNRLEMPAYHLIGNHELRGMTKDQWLAINKYENSYYSVDLEKLRIIVLDSDVIGKPNNFSKDEAYEKQYNWLKDLLENSRKIRKIVFIHQSTLPRISYSLASERLDRLNELFSRFKVMAVFSGHSELLDYEKKGGVEYYSIPGLYRSKYNKMKPDWFGCFAELTAERAIHLKLFYKETEFGEYKTMNVPSEEYYKAEQEQKRTENLNDPEEVEEETEG